MLIKRVAAVAVCAMAFVGLAATQASAYPDRGGGSVCPEPGPNGAVCLHVETDIGSGHIRARFAIDPSPGKRIGPGAVELYEVTTERATGQQTTTQVAENLRFTWVTSGVFNDIAGPHIEQCDTKLATFQWFANSEYTTSTGEHFVHTPLYPGAC